MTDEERWERAKAEWPLGTKLEGTVVKVQPFGAFLDLGDGALGLIKITEAPDWFPPGGPPQMPEVGTPAEATVLHFDERNRQVLLTLLEWSE